MSPRPGTYAVISHSVRSLPWSTKLAIADAQGTWPEHKESAVSHLQNVTPTDCGFGSSDINHVAMEMVEQDIIQQLTGQS